MFLVEPMININPCFCDQCFKLLENHNKFNETQELIEHYTDISCVSIEVEDNIKRNRNSKIKSIPGTICSIRGCSNISTHPIPLDECKKLKQIFSLFDFSHVSQLFIQSSYNNELICQWYLYNYFDFTDIFDWIQKQNWTNEFSFIYLW